MTASNLPFSLVKEITLQVPSQTAWDLFVSPYQDQWNHAITRMETSLGFHTGSQIHAVMQTLRGAVEVTFEVTESTPRVELVMESKFRHMLLHHTEYWHFHFEQSTEHITHVKAQYALDGPFAAKLWRTKHTDVSHVLELWLESIKQKLERL